MTRSWSRTRPITLALCVGLSLLAGCTDTDPPSDGYSDSGVPTGTWRLVAFDSCVAALNGMRTAAKAVVGPYGFGGYGFPEPAAGGAPPLRKEASVPMADQAAPAAPGNPNGPTEHSGTNTHEVGVDEPDLIKTDGRRIVTVANGRLRVIDAATHTVTATVSLAGGLSADSQPGIGRPDLVQPADLLLHGDHALVLLRENVVLYGGSGGSGGPALPRPVGSADSGEPTSGVSAPSDDPIVGPRLVLVDLTGAGRILSTLRTDGALVDARQVGATVRVVARSAPRLTFPYHEKGDDRDRIAANRAIIDKAGVDRWLPRVEVTTGEATHTESIGCDAVSRPEAYTATNLVTVFTLNLAGTTLDAPQPTSLLADGDTVYSSGKNLYVASDLRPRFMPMGARWAGSPPSPRTQIYQFDTSTPDRPIFVAGGSVAGYLINQYAMSEWDGHLRVATTTGETLAGAPRAGDTQSSVHVLTRSGSTLASVAHVDGLGAGERIYAVRFVGPVGYVVTFRQTDPLYTVDLRDPLKPRIRGELKITGYSAYLHPVGDTLIGVGQEATAEGRALGTQLSVFDVNDLDNPRRSARYTLSGAFSEAEFDPHAFLYWPADHVVVMPLSLNHSTTKTIGPDGIPVPPPPATIGALVLRVDANRVEKLGFISHPSPVPSQPAGWPPQIRRSLIISQALWTLSDAGLLAVDTHTLRRIAWIPLS